MSKAGSEGNGVPTPQPPEWVSGRILHFVRHGQYYNDPSGNGGLTPLGRRQAVRVARHFRRLPIAAVASSDVPRAMETADILAAKLGLVGLRRHRILREILPSPVPGMEVPMKKRKEGRERLERVVARFFKRSGRTRHEVIVCHANLIRSLVLRVTSGSPLGFHQFRMHHGGITSFVVSERGVNVIGFNVLEHLPFDMRSER